MKSLKFENDGRNYGIEMKSSSQIGLI